MARINYTFQKQQRAAAKSRRQEEKRNMRHQRPQNASPLGSDTEQQS